MLDNVLKWITAIGSVLTAFSVFIVWLEFKADHERSRREKTCELMALWTTCVSDMKMEVRHTISLLPYLDEHQCQCLWEKQPFEIELKHEELIKSALNLSTDSLGNQKANGKICLSSNQSNELRIMAINYLNLLEVIFAAWRNNIVDKNMVFDEFAHLVSPKKDYFPLNNLRIATGVFPSLAEFSKHMSKEYEKIKIRNKVA